MKNTKTDKPVSSAKSIFKDGQHAPSKDKYTKLWITYINMNEKAKRDTPSVRY